MKMTADQLLKIAGIASTDTLRARLNESANPDITSVTYTYEIRYNGASAEAQHPDGSTSYIAHEEPFDMALRYEDISANHMSQIDYANIQSVLTFLVEEGYKDFDGDEQEYKGDTGVLFDRAGMEHDRLLGTGVKTKFEVGYDS